MASSCNKLFLQQEQHQSQSQLELIEFMQSLSVLVVQETLQQ
jgi:hypothetical protein